MFHRLAICAFGAHPYHAPALAQEPGDGHAFQHLRSFRPSMVYQHLVEFRAQYLPRLGDIFVIASVEVKRLRCFAGCRYELDAVLFNERGLTHLIDQPQAL